MYKASAFGSTSEAKMRKRFSWGSSDERVMRKCPVLAPAREAYSGSASWSLRLEVAHSLRTASLFLAFSSPTLVSAAALATLRIQPLVKILATNSSGEQEWSPAIAGQAARSMHEGGVRPSPSITSAQ